MHQRELGLEPPVGQVGEERLQLAGREHALVDEGATRERREVDLGLALGALAQAEGEAVEAEPDHPADGGRHEQLAEERHAVAGRLAHELGGHGHVAPPEDGEPLLGGQRLDPGDHLGPLGLVGRQEGGAHGIRTVDRQVEVDDLAEERVGDLGEDAGAVTHQRVGAGGAAVVEVAQGGQGVLDDVVAGASPHRRHEGHAAGVVLVLAAVEARVGGLGGEARRGHVRVTVLGGSQVRCGTQVGHTMFTRVDGLGHGCRQDSRCAVCPAM